MVTELPRYRITLEELKVSTLDVEADSWEGAQELAYEIDWSFPDEMDEFIDFYVEELDE